MVSLAAFASLEWGRGEVTLERFDGFSSVRINAEVAPGYTTGAAMTRLAELVRELGPEYDVRWTGRAFEQEQTGTQRRGCSRCRCCSSSCAWWRCMKAGPCRWR